MTLENIAQGEPWMTPAELQTVAGLVQSFRQTFSDGAIPETPFLVLRVQDLLVNHTLCRRLERSLLADPAPLSSGLAAQLGRARDRFRRSLKDLETTANKLAPKPAASKPAHPSPENGHPSSPNPASSPNSPLAPGQSPRTPANEEPPNKGASHNAHSSHTSQPQPAAFPKLPTANVPQVRPLRA